MTLSIALPSRRSTLHLAQRLAPLLRVGDLLVLSGALGAGKTFLVRGMARCLQLPQGERVTSPTFTLVQELPTSPPLVHADLYRIAAPEELSELGLLAARNQATLVVEWGLPYVAELGGDALCLEITLQPRVVRAQATGQRSAELLEQLDAHLPLPVPRALRA